jgi:multidrug efflux pump
MRGVNDNWNEQIKVLRLQIDQDKARALGVSSQSIAQGSRGGLSGTTVGQYREGDKLIDIVLRQPLEERNVLTDIGNAFVPTSSGRTIPLTQIAKIDLAWEPGVLWREGRQYAITVQGDVVDGVQGPTVTQAVWPQLQALKASMPPGYDIEHGRRAGAEQQGHRLASWPACPSCCSSSSRC